jgi:hypothetical protein
MGLCYEAFEMGASYADCGTQKSSVCNEQKTFYRLLLLCIGTHGAILQPVMKIGFIYPLIMKLFGYKKGKTDFEDVLNLTENMWTETILNNKIFFHLFGRYPHTNLFPNTLYTKIRQQGHLRANQQLTFPGHLKQYAIGR